MLHRTTPGIWAITDEQYYADTTHVSKSMVDVFKKSIPKYSARFVHGLLPPDEPTKEMLQGTALHTMLFAASEPIPTECEKDRRLIESWAAAVLAHPRASQILGHAELVEKVLRWNDPATGLACKCKADAISRRIAILGDLKTTKDCSPDAFNSSIERYGYYRQMAHYLDGCKHALGLELQGVFIAVDKSSLEVGVYELDDEWLRIGREENARDLAELAECYRSGRWTSRLAQIRLLSPQRWKVYQHDRQHN